MENNKKKTFTIVFTVFALVLVIGTTYAFVTRTLTGTKKVTLTAGTLSLVLDEKNEITISDALPMYDAVGMIQEEVFEFDLINNTSNPTGKDIGCLLSIKSGREYLTLSSGVLQDYKSFTPKYQMYEKHIQDAYKEGFKYCNFYGITGDFNPENKYYGIYEFKKGFSGNVIEYVGEFELEVTSFNKFYKVLRKIKELLRRHTP